MFCPSAEEGQVNIDHMDVSIFIFAVIMAEVFASALCSNLKPDKFPFTELSKKSQYFVGLLKYTIVANN